MGLALLRRYALASLALNTTRTYSSLIQIPQRPIYGRYYENITRLKQKPKRLPVRNPTVTASVCPHLIETGDLVELTYKDGAIRFGLVTWSPLGSSFDVVDVEGNSLTANVCDVSVVFKNAFSTSHRAETWTPASISVALHQLVREGTLKIKKMLPYLQVAYAQYSLNARTRAIDFEELCTRVMLAKSVYGEKKHALISDKLAIYLAAVSHDVSFVRLDTRSPLALVSVNTMDAINKVTKALTRTEFVNAVRALATRRVHANHPLPASALSMVKLLKHYMVFDDHRLANVVLSIMMQVYPERDDTYSLSRPSSVKLFLEQIGLIDDPFLDIDMLDTADQSKAIDSPHAVHPPSAPFPLPVFALAQDIGVSVDKSIRDKTIVGLHIPYVPVASVLGSTSPFGIQAKSIHANGTRVHSLVSDSTRERFALAPGKELVCLSVTAEVSGWNHVWDPSSIKVSFASCEIHDTGAHFFNETKSLNKEEGAVVAYFDGILSHYGGRGSPEFDGVKSTEKPADRARILAGEWLATFCMANHIDITYLCKQKLKAFPAVNEPGTVEVEQITSVPKPHEELNVSAFVPIGKPFDSSLSLLAQMTLARHFSGTTRANPYESLAATFNRNVLPNAQFQSSLQSRIERYNVLSTLEKYLQTNCLPSLNCVVSETASYPKIASAHSPDLGVDVDLVLQPGSSVEKGDTVSSTNIIHLDPLLGTLVLCM